jgi:hypothetical protein
MLVYRNQSAKRTRVILIPFYFVFQGLCSGSFFSKQRTYSSSKTSTKSFGRRTMSGFFLAAAGIYVLTTIYRKLKEDN